MWLREKSTKYSEYFLGFFSFKKSQSLVNSVPDPASSNTMSIYARYSTKIQSLLPQHLLSRFAGWMARCQFPPLKNYLIRWFIRRYPVDLSQAVRESPGDYVNFSSFFTRQLKPEYRPIATAQNGLVSPVDGVVSQVGAIASGRIFQAKGFDFDLLNLVGNLSETACLFEQGRFATLYLAPKDYHRVHMPLAGKLVSMTYVPGRLFSVNPQTVAQVPGLFSRNERLICVFNTARGPLAIIFVGAMLVASIHTTWAGLVSPSKTGKLYTVNYSEGEVSLEKGQEVGYFTLGSTVILLTKSNLTWNDDLDCEKSVQMGELLGRFKE